MSKKSSGVFNKKIEQLLKKGRPRIGFGLAEPDKEIIKSLQKSKKYADIILVGLAAIKNVKGFKVVVDDNPEERLAAMLAKDEVQGIVRGTIDDFKTYEAYQRLTGEKETINPALMQDTSGRQFFMSPGSNPEGWKKEERLSIALAVAEFAKEWGIKLKIAVLAAERHDTYPRRKHIKDGVVGFLNRTYEDAEWLVSQLQAAGHDAKNWSIDFNPAVESGCNLIIPVNGMVGNQTFRGMYICGGKILAAPRLGLSRCYEDNSRTEKDYAYHIKWLAAWINSRRK